MGSRIRVSLVGLLVLIAVAAVAPSAQAAPEIASFFASNCKVSTCEIAKKASEEEELAKKNGYTQAGGHPNFGITDFTVATEKSGKPTGIVEHIRTDVAPGVSTNPQAVPECTMEQFDGYEGKTLEAHKVFLKPECPGSKAKSEEEVPGPESSVIGVNEATVYIEGLGDFGPLVGNVYNLVPAAGKSSDFAVALPLPKFITEKDFEKTPFEKAQFYAHTFIEGDVEWGAEPAGTGKADYHDFFEIAVSPALPLVRSRLIFDGRSGNGTFLTNPTSCTGTGPQTTTTLKLEFAEGSPATDTYKTALGTENCGVVKFSPGFSLSQGTTSSDAPDGLLAELSDQVPTESEPEDETAIDKSQVKAVTVKLPPGLTLNPSAANGLEDCTPAQVGIGTLKAAECPEGSKIGTADLEVPGLPAGSLQGSIYLGGPESGPIAAPPYPVYIVTESVRYGVKVRLKGETVPNEETGQLTTIFKENPEQPFRSLALHFNGGPLAPLANGVACEANTVDAGFEAFSAHPESTGTANFEVAGCESPLKFAPSQATANATTTAGGHTSYDFTLARSDKEQYFEKIKTTLPAGLVGVIPSVVLCSEEQANAGTCGEASRIGSATVTAGAGRIPYTFNGTVSMTGPYDGAPYGLSISVPAVAGPFNFGNVVTRAKVDVNPITAQVEVESTLPTIKDGVPLRLKTVNVDVNRQDFLDNPTSCSALSTESTIGSIKGAASAGPLVSSFQLSNCSSLGFKPSFAVSTGAKASKTNGASLITTIKMPSGDANIKSVLVTLPSQLPSRLTTLQKACPVATFDANPLSCEHTEAEVGTATAVTPTLPQPMVGPAILVSHGGEAFPELELVLEGNNGVRVILAGKTNIKNSITTSDFATNPDVPVSSFTLDLGMGPHSALGVYGSLCKPTLLMPTTITGQNGTVFSQDTKITVTGCGVQILGQKVIGRRLYLTLKTFAAGRVTATGRGVTRTSRSLSRAYNSVALVVPIPRHGRYRSTVRVSFTPRRGSGSSATASVRLP